MTRSLAGLLVGRLLADRYDIEELIGRGGMSLVYRASDRRLRRAVAVKVISLPSDSEQQHQNLRERLRREAAAAARVPPHPNVVQVYDYGTDAELDLDFIAMELLQGRDLKAILKEGPLPHQESIRILREVARGLSAGHRAGIIHRDVKPANIIVTTDDPARTVKLLDFGIAKALEAPLDDDLTRTGQAPHSPAYASPEQLNPGEPVTAASDVYQLGVVACEMLCGQRPPRGDPSEVAGWDAVSDRVRLVIATAMRRRPEERYANAAAFAEALSRASELEDGTTLMEPDPEPAARSRPDEREEGTMLIAPDPVPSSPGSARPAPPATAPLPEPGLHGARKNPLRRPGRAIAWAAVAILLLLALRAGIGGGEGDPSSRATPLASDLEALDEEFRDLLEEAHRNLAESEPETPTP